LISTEDLEKIAREAGEDPVWLEAHRGFMDPLEFRGFLLDHTRGARMRLYAEGKLDLDSRTPLNTPGYEYPT
jgi:hypothetical protein